MEKTFLLHLSAHWGDLIEQIKKSVIYTLNIHGIVIIRFRVQFGVNLHE